MGLLYIQFSGTSLQKLYAVDEQEANLGLFLTFATVIHTVYLGKHALLQYRHMVMMHGLDNINFNLENNVVRLWKKLENVQNAEK